ncbi:MAG: cytochrome c [FCB group bacterium]|nr:cytochrome c [FCB group bacterium]
MKLKTLLIALGTGFGLLLLNCQGTPSRNAPIHLNPNMDTQKRYDPQAASGFFIDGRTMRPPVPGTVARDGLRLDDAFYRGEDGKGQEIKYIPVDLDENLLARGEERYNIYCSPCHSELGDGKGIVMQYNFPIPPPSFHTEKVRDFTDGYLFKVITNGVRNMPAYRHQIKVRDRWAIVAYIRALQLSQNASAEDVPLTELNGLK